STSEGYTIKRSFPSLLANSDFIDHNDNLISYTRWSHLMSRDIISKTGLHLYRISPSTSFSNVKKHVTTEIINFATEDWTTQPDWISQEFEIYVNTFDNQASTLTNIGYI